MDARESCVDMVVSTGLVGIMMLVLSVDLCRSIQLSRYVG